MFASPEVGDIALEVLTTVDTTSTECEGCRRLEADITLLVTTGILSEDPVTISVLSNQTFIVKPDDADPTKWVLFRQIDREATGKRGAMDLADLADDPTTWGQVKGFLFPPAIVATGPKRDTPEALLEEWFPAAYEGKDFAAYIEMLHPDFQFEFLFEDAESLRAAGILEPGISWWPLLQDTASTGRMFRSPNVGDISLGIRITEEDSSGMCEGCREIETAIDLDVVTDPQAIDPTILQVQSDQVFVVRPDPGDASKWVIWRQYDRPSRFVNLAATAPASWGQVKSVFQ
jgi:hypothetical protein